MDAPKRFELVIPANRRAALDDLARALGTTTAELDRIGICWVLENQDFLRRGRPVSIEAAQREVA